MSQYDVIQTFFVPGDSVNKSPYCFITGIDLYFKAKPDSTVSGVSGIFKPGVTVHLCPVSRDNLPDPDSIITDSLVRLSYDEIPIYSYEIVQRSVIDTTKLQTYDYSAMYTDSAWSTIMPKDNLITFPPYYFDFAPIDSTATLYFSCRGKENKGYNFTVSNETKGTFIQASSATYPGLAQLTTEDKRYVGDRLKADSWDTYNPWTYGRGTNEIRGAGKFTWTHSKNNKSRYTINLGSGKGTGARFILRYASAIKTNTSLDSTIKVPGITSGSRVYGNAAKVIFNTPVVLKSDTLYGIVIDYEDPDYQLWTNKQGERLIGTIGQTGNVLSPGASGKGDGNYFDFSNDQLRTQSDRDIMFEVYAAKFTANTADVEIANKDYEFITVNGYSLTSNNLFEGEYVYQDYGNPTIDATYGFTGSGFFKQGTVTAVSAAVGSPPNLSLIGSNTVFTQDFSVGDLIVLTDLTASNTDVREITNVANNTYMTISESPSFSNSAAYLKKTAIAKLYNLDYGTNNIILVDSNANSSIKFQNDGIKYITIATAGSGYNNTDILRVYDGGATLNATASVKTNSSGAIVGFRFSNLGSGFTSAPSYIVSNSTVLTSNTSLGTSAAFTANIQGSVIVGDTSRASANIVSLDDYKVSVFDPDIKVNRESVDTTITVKHNFAYSSGGNYYVNTSYLTTSIDTNNYITNYNALILSRSKEVANPTYLYNSDKSSIMKINLTAKKPVASGLWVSPIVHTDKLNVFTYKYDVNNDSTNETTKYGSTISKYVSTKVSFANNKFAEDIRVYMTAYKPVGTDIKVYAKIYHPSDSESYDSKLWTPLNVTSGAGLNSSTTNFNDVIQMNFGFPPWPTINSTLTGTVTVASGSATITGAGTSFNTDLTTNSLVKIYDPLNSDTNYFLAVVTNIGGATTITINSTTTNASIIGTGFKIDKLNSTLDNTGFLNPQNFNIVRYYNNSLEEFDGFNTMAVKVLLLSTNINLVPEVEDIRVIGLSA